MTRYQLLSLSLLTDLHMEYANRNLFFDDWEVPLQRICANEERLFDCMGPFHVRLTRLGKPISLHTHVLGEVCLSNVDARKNATLCPKDLPELGDHLMITSDDNFRILYVTEILKRLNRLMRSTVPFARNSRWHP